MKSFRTLSAVVVLTGAAAATSARAGDCASAQGPLQVDFPRVAQEQRRHGAVQVAVRLAADGRVVAADVVQSSGHPVLDAATRKSAREYWRFSVKACSPLELQRSRVVTVSFVKPTGLTVSGTMDRRGAAKHRALAADESCQGVRTDLDTTVFSCRRTTSTQYVSRARRNE